MERLSSDNSQTSTREFELVDEIASTGIQTTSADHNSPEPQKFELSRIRRVWFEILTGSNLAPLIGNAILRLDSGTATDKLRQLRQAQRISVKFL